MLIKRRGRPPKIVMESEKKDISDKSSDKGKVDSQYRTICPVCNTDTEVSETPKERVIICPNGHRFNHSV